MNVKKLLKDNPLSKEVIKLWFLSKLLESLKTAENISEEFKQDLINKGVVDEVLEKYIENNPHALFEMFDEYDLFINIFKNKKEVGYRINEFIGNTLLFDNRKETEFQAIQDCLILLETKLKTNITNG